MNYRNNLLVAEEAAPPKIKNTKKKTGRSLEYSMLAQMTMQHFAPDGEPDFRQLLSIPLGNRIPALSEEYTPKRVHRMVSLILKEFAQDLSPDADLLLAQERAACAGELILSAGEDQLALEDLIVFFERARTGVYGPLSGTGHRQVMQRLEKYRQHRHEALMDIRRSQQEEHKKQGSRRRAAATPAPICQLFGPEARIVPLYS